MAVVPKQNGLNILRKLVPLNTLTEETLTELMETVAFEKISKGDFLFRAGDTDPERVYLLSGRVALLEDGKEIDAVAADSNMARYPIAHHIPRKFSVQARTKAEIVRIDSNLLSNLLTRGGNVLYQVEELNADAEDDWMGQLLQSPIFQRIPAANIQNIMMRMEEVQVAAGEMVIRQGDEGDYFYLINRGQCSITRQRGDGEVEEIAQLGAGHCLGEESLLSGKPRGSTVSMLTDGVLFRLGKKDFVEYIKMPLANAIGYADALSKVEKGAVWLDVRSPLEYSRLHIPKSQNTPFNDLRSALPDLASDKTYIAYCQDGLVSSTAVYLLMEKGLEAFVLQRGLESVPDDVLKRDKSQEGAEIINLRPEQESATTERREIGAGPVDEAGLLRERLQQTEAQAQEQMQGARKLKLMLEKLKGRLAEAEAGETRANEESSRLSADIKKLQQRLVEEQEKSATAFAKQQASIEKRLTDVTGERDHLQEELGRVYQQIGKLEKRLEAKQRDEAQWKASQAELQSKLQQALDAHQRELEQAQGEKRALTQETKRLQGSLDGAHAELEKLGDELRQSRQAAEETLVKQREDAQRQASQAEGELQQALRDSGSELERMGAEKVALEQATLALQEGLDAAHAEREALGIELQQARQAAEQVEVNRQAIERELQELRTQAAALRDAQVDVQREAQEQAGAMEQALAAAEKQQLLYQTELDQLRKELEGANARIADLDAERQALQQAQRERQGEQEARLQQALDEAVEGSARAESALQAVTDERDRVAAELAVLQKNFGQLQQLADERENSLVELRLQTQQEQRAGAKDESTLSEQQAELARLGSALEATNTELDSAREMVRDKALELEDLQQSLASGKVEAAQLAAQLEASEQALQTLRLEHEQQAGELAGLNDERQQLQQQLTIDQARIGELESRLTEESSKGVEQDALRAELAEATAARVAAESALATAGQSGAGSQTERNEVKAVQAELETLNDALDEADRAYEALEREKAKLQEELERLRGDAPADDERVALIEQKQQAELEVTRLSTELAQLREQVDAGTSVVDGASDVATVELQAALEQAHSRLKELELGSAADAAECEVLRQDVDKLKRSLDERSAELERTRKESLLLEEKTEERNSEVDRLKLALEAAQVDADEAVFKKEEALEARKQVEASLYELQKQIEHGRPRDDLLEKRLTTSMGGLDIGQGGNARQKLTALLVGAVLAFAVADGLSILGGKGEIISGFLDDADNVPNAPEEVAVLSKEPASQPQSRLDLSSEPEPVSRVAPPVQSPVQSVVPSAPVTESAPKPVAPKIPPKLSEPVTGTLIQDRLKGGGSAPEMVYVNGGSFLMGSSISQLASEEQPVHEVTLNSFSIGRYEVTFREYEQFAAATGRSLPDDLGWGQGPRPVINVSWNDARAYTDWLSKQTGNRYRLPTEAEWEYAAAAGTDTPYWWGFDLGSGNANCFNCGSEWDGASTAPVGRFAANPFGLHNTAGNVMEWVEDCYHNSYDGAPADGSSWQEPACRERVVRGGAFNKPGESLRVTRRGRHDVDARLLVLGFRVVREVR